MANRLSFVRDQVHYQREYSLNTGQLTFELAGRNPWMSFAFADMDSGKRKRPSVPELYPTGLKKFEWITLHGRANCTTFEFPSKHVAEGAAFTFNPGLAWNSLPGVSMFGNGVPTYTRNVELEWLCAANLKRKILNSSLAMSVTLAEAKTTVTWIAQRTSDIALAMRAVKKADWKSLKRTVKNVSAEYKKLDRGRTPREVRIHSNGRLTFEPKFKPTELPDTPPKGWSTKTAAARWLEVRYAITPLLADVDGVARNLAEFLYDNRLEFMHKWATAVDIPPDKPGVNLMCRSTRKWGGALSLKAAWKSARMVKYSVYYVYSKWQAAFSKLQLTNVPLVAWEVVPYSFVFDWAVDMGDYLELANATVGCEFLSGTLSYRVAGELQPAPVVFVPNLRTTTFSNVIPPWTRYRAYERKAIGAFPDFLPTVRSPLSTTHLIDALALIRVTKP